MPTKSERLTYDEIVESLYDLTHPQLRKLAVECLLITDGPDKVTSRGGSRRAKREKATTKKVTASAPTGKRVRRLYSKQLGGYTYNGIELSKCQCNLSGGRCSCGHYESERDKEIARRAKANKRRQWSA